MQWAVFSGKSYLLRQSSQLHDVCVVEADLDIQNVLGSSWGRLYGCGAHQAIRAYTFA